MTTAHSITTKLYNMFVRYQLKKETPSIICTQLKAQATKEETSFMNNIIKKRQKCLITITLPLGKI